MAWRPLAMVTVAHAEFVSSDPGVSGALSVARFASLLGVLVLCGGVAFLTLAWPAGAGVAAARRLLWSAWLLGTAGTLAALALSGPASRRLPMTSAVRTGVLRETLGTNAGHAWAARLLLCLLAVPVLRALSTQGRRAVRSVPWCIGAIAVGGALVRSTSLASHATEGSNELLGVVADAVHVGSAAVWLGGLAVLALVVLPRRDADELARVVPRFSSLAAVAVAVVIAAGTVLAWELVGGMQALVTTRYGRLLLVKIALVAGALAAARTSKAWVDRRLALTSVIGCDRAVITPFVLSVVTEVVLAGGVLTAASLLIATSPAR